MDHTKLHIQPLNDIGRKFSCLNYRKERLLVRSTVEDCTINTLLRHFVDEAFGHVEGARFLFGIGPDEQIENSGQEPIAGLPLTMLRA